MQCTLSLHPISRHLHSTDPASTFSLTYAPGRICKTKMSNDLYTSAWRDVSVNSEQRSFLLEFMFLTLFQDIIFQDFISSMSNPLYITFIFCIIIQTLYIYKHIYIRRTNISARSCVLRTAGLSNIFLFLFAENQRKVICPELNTLYNIYV